MTIIQSKASERVFCPECGGTVDLVHAPEWASDDDPGTVCLGCGWSGDLPDLVLWDVEAQRVVGWATFADVLAAGTAGTFVSGGREIEVAELSWQERIKLSQVEHEALYGPLPLVGAMTVTGSEF